MPLSPLLFVHIPKTAGSTLHSILSQQYLRNRTLVTSDPRDSLIRGGNRSNVEDCPFDLIIGHCPVGMHEILPTLKYASCVRDPAKRIISHYYHVKASSGHRLHEVIQARKISLKDYVESDLTNEISNGMVRMLSGMRDPIRGEVTEAVFDQALEMVQKHFVFVAVTERFDESVLALRKILGISTPYYITKKVGKYPGDRSEVTPELIDLIRQRNDFDQQLYEHVCGLLDQKMARLGITAARVHRFAERNRRIGKAVVYVREARARLFGGKKVAGTLKRPDRSRYGEEVR